MQRLTFFCLILIGLLAACDGNSPQPLVVVATSPAPDAGFRTYRDTSEVFTIRIPPGWIPDQLPDENGVRTQFSSIEGNESVVRVSVYVVNTGQPLTPETFLATVNAYQPPLDVAAVPWKPVENMLRMADNSVRLTGIRDYPTLGTRTMNIFLQGNGSYFTAIEVDVTNASPELTQILMAVVNTYRVDTNVPLTVGDVIPAGLVSESGVIAFQQYTHWQDANGGFNITGKVLNTTERDFEAVRLTAYLFDTTGNQLAERSTVLTYDILPAGESAPFRIRFDTGRPSRAVRYELHAAARNAEFSLANFYSQDKFFIANENVTYNRDGYLTITGQLQNQAAGIAEAVKLIATIYNDQGDVVATETSFVNKDQLLPGEATNFEVTVYDIGGDAQTFDLIAQGNALP